MQTEEEKKAYQRKYREEHKEYFESYRRYYKALSEGTTTATSPQEFRAKEKQAEYSHRWYLKHKDAFLESRRRQYREKKEKELAI